MQIKINKLLQKCIIGGEIVKVRKIAIFVMIIIFTLIFLVSSYILIKIFLDFKEVEKETIKLKEDIIKISIDNEDNTEFIINWEELENINKDIIGWLKINDTKINYPIVQDTNLYYINHTFEKKYNINGSIFTKTNKPFEVKETIIYGHNNKNNLMFSEIENFMNHEFFKNHQTFKIYTKSSNYDAKIFSIYSIGVNEENKNIQNLSFEECIEYYKKQSKFKVENQEIPENIIKLSTCSYLNNKETPTEQRYYLVASLIKS